MRQSNISKGQEKEKAPVGAFLCRCRPMTRPTKPYLDLPDLTPARLSLVDAYAPQCPLIRKGMTLRYLSSFLVMPCKAESFAIASRLIFLCSSVSSVIRRCRSF